MPQSLSLLYPEEYWDPCSENCRLALLLFPTQQVKGCLRCDISINEWYGVDGKLCMRHGAGLSTTHVATNGRLAGNTSTSTTSASPPGLHSAHHACMLHTCILLPQSHCLNANDQQLYVCNCAVCSRPPSVRFLAHNGSRITPTHRSVFWAIPPEPHNPRSPPCACSASVAACVQRGPRQPLHAGQCLAVQSWPTLQAAAPAMTCIATHHVCFTACTLSHMSNKRGHCAAFADGTHPTMRLPRLCPLRGRFGRSSSELILRGKAVSLTAISAALGSTPAACTGATSSGALCFQLTAMYNALLAMHTAAQPRIPTRRDAGFLLQHSLSRLCCRSCSHVLLWVLADARQPALLRRLRGQRLQAGRHGRQIRQGHDTCQMRRCRCLCCLLGRLSIQGVACI